MEHRAPSSRTLLSAVALAVLLWSCQEHSAPDPATPAPLAYADAHTHLTTYGEACMDSLVKYGVSIVRDCGGDLELLKKWRSEINGGTRTGPHIYFAGPKLDGMQELPDRVGVTTVEQARRVVDSLATLGVDFIKTGGALSPACYFAILREARVKHLKVTSHLSGDLLVWQAADSGLSCIEHTAESFLAAPSGAGYVKGEGDTALFRGIAWWRSAQGDSVIQHLGTLKVTCTPTLYSYKVWALQGETKEDVDGRLRVLDFLKELTFKLHKAGVTILAGTDLYDRSWQNEVPGKSLFSEIAMLEEAGLTKQEATDAATVNVKAWLEK